MLGARDEDVARGPSRSAASLELPVEAIHCRTRLRLGRKRTGDADVVERRGEMSGCRSGAGGRECTRCSSRRFGGQPGRQVVRSGRRAVGVAIGRLVCDHAQLESNPVVCRDDCACGVPGARAAVRRGLGERRVRRPPRGRLRVVDGRRADERVRELETVSRPAGKPLVECRSKRVELEAGGPPSRAEPAPLRRPGEARDQQHPLSRLGQREKAMQIRLLRARARGQSVAERLLAPSLRRGQAGRDGEQRERVAAGDREDPLGDAWCQVGDPFEQCPRGLRPERRQQDLVDRKFRERVATVRGQDERDAFGVQPSRDELEHPLGFLVQVVGTVDADEERFVATAGVEQPECRGRHREQLAVHAAHTECVAKGARLRLRHAVEKIEERLAQRRQTAVEAVAVGEIAGDLHDPKPRRRSDRLPQQRRLPYP